MNEFTIFFIILYAIVTPLAAMLWPKRKLVLWVWAIPVIIVYPLLWQRPGIASVIVGMLTLLIFIRALDANALFAEKARNRYALYCHWLLPNISELRDADPVAKRTKRMVRGCLFILAAIGLMYLGKQIELWRTFPYLDDLMMAAELSLGFVGMMEVITVFCMTLGIQFSMVDGFPADFIFAPSLRAFWSKWWNRVTSDVLNRGIFLP